MTIDGYKKKIIAGKTCWESEDGYTFPVISGSDDAQIDENAAPKADGDAGDPADSGRDPDESVRAEAEGTSEGDEGRRAAGDKGEKTVPYSRFRDVNGKLRDWKKIGDSPDEVLSKLQRLEAIERAAAGRAHDQGDEAAAQAADRRANAFRAVMDETFGEGTSARFSDFQESQRMQVLAHAKQGAEYLKEWMDDHGLPTDSKNVVEWERRIGDELRADEALLSSFYNPVAQRKAVEDAADRLLGAVVNPSLAAVGAGKLIGGQRRRAAALGSARASTPAAFEQDLEPPKDMTDPEKRADWWRSRKDRAWREYADDGR